MKIKLDENLPVRLAGALEKLGHDTDTIPVPPEPTMEFCWFGCATLDGMRY